MAQHRGKSSLRCSLRDIRTRVQPWQMGVAALAIGVVCLLLLHGCSKGTSFTIDRAAESGSAPITETQVELEGDSFEQFQQGSSNIQVTSSSQEEDMQVKPIIIDVDGAVRSPGVYELEGETPRVNDAVLAAGGLMEDADTSQVNLAAPLDDGSKVYIPHAGEVIGAAVTGGLSAQEWESATVGTPTDDGLININTATNEELKRLPGVGEATAAAIIREREANGPFTSPEDIMRVSGIGEKKYEKMRDMICV